MYYDFNLPYPKTKNPKDLNKLDVILKRIQSIDRAMIAWNVSSVEFKPLKDVKPHQPAVFKNIQQLIRATVTVTDPKKNYQLVSANPANQTIDILAVQPTTKDALKHTCLVHEIDLVSIDLTIQPPLLPGHASAQVAINRGIFFEICYTEAIQDPQRRSVFFSNVNKLIQHTRGHNLILSSGALRALEIKRPSDIRMLALMFGMTEVQAENAVGHNYQRLLRKAETRKNTILAAISINKSPSSDPPTEVTESSNTSNQQKRKQKNKDNNKQQKKQKTQGHAK
ncbi:RNase P subunit p30-domain-containing protein [Chlamydoabsidia padenii]|nr:RNase P subunit p30-domain-containing protein [Chlamydoabsidia padenii]